MYTKLLVGCVPAGSEMSDSTSGPGFLEQPSGDAASAFSAPVDPHSIAARLNAHGDASAAGLSVESNATTQVRDIPDSSGVGAAAAAERIDQDLELEPAVADDEETVRSKDLSPHIRPLTEEDDDEEEHLTPDQLGVSSLLLINAIFIASKDMFSSLHI